MEERKNLCAMLPVSLHARVRREQEKAGMTLGEYVEALITEYYDWKDGKIMTGEMRTFGSAQRGVLSKCLRYLCRRRSSQATNWDASKQTPHNSFSEAHKTFPAPDYLWKLGHRLQHADERQHHRNQPVSLQDR